MSKKLVTSYTFTASAKTIVSADFTSLEKIQLVTNVTRNIIIYNFASATLGGTLSGTTLTLTYNTAAAMADADKLQIFVEDAAVAIPVTAASLPLPALAATSTKQSDGTQKTQVVDGSGNVLAVPLEGATFADTLRGTLLYGREAGTGAGAVAHSLVTNSSGVLKSDPSGVTSPVSLATVPSHAVTNVGTFAVQATLAAETTKIIGTINNLPTTVDTNSGVKSASTLRVVLATDQPALTNKLLVTPDSVALPANQSVNNAQINGVTPLMGNGVSGTGAQRVTIASDSTGQVALAAGSATIGALTANQSVNVAQMNGVTVTMGNGVAGTGVQRVTMASDSTANIATIGTSVTPGTAAANLGKAEDAVHASGDTGVMNLAVANEALSSISGTDGDYTPHGVDRKGRLFVVQKANTSTLTNVASSATSVTLLASNSARISATIYNDSTQVCYVKFGATASSTSFTVPLATNTYYEVPGGYTGIIDGIWVSANGNARVTELT